jgi:hypothetical protein
LEKPAAAKRARHSFLNLLKSYLGFGALCHVIRTNPLLKKREISAPKCSGYGVLAACPVLHFLPFLVGMQQPSSQKMEINVSRSENTNTNQDTTPPRDQAEYDAGYNAFMFCTAIYAMGYGGMGHRARELFHTTEIDVKPETKPETRDYVESWNDARARMQREADIGYGGQFTARGSTADAHTNKPASNVVLIKAD